MCWRRVGDRFDDAAGLAGILVDTVVMLFAGQDRDPCRIDAWLDERLAWLTG
jgi:hypothetical protein